MGQNRLLWELTRMKSSTPLEEILWSYSTYWKINFDRILIELIEFHKCSMKSDKGLIESEKGSIESKKGFYRIP